MVNRVFALVFLFTQVFCSPTKVISTSLGRLEGKYVNQNQLVFKKVPYAQPPLGKLRFSLPRWHGPWKDVKNATEYGPACWSNSTTRTPSNYAEMSEDCLFINVFTNDYCLESKTCQTIIYYHGGGFNLDNAIMFNDSFILERYVEKNIIFVIPSYRQGIFGLLYFGDDNLVPHNLAIYDCELALKFIHREISHFGGNPDDINLMGHSAGAHVALNFGFSRLIDPDRVLFKKLIVISAVPSYDMPELLIKNSYDFATNMGCNSSSDFEIVKCLREKDPHELILAQREMENDYLYFWNFLKGLPFMDPNETIENFKLNAVPRDMYIGTTIDEVGTKRPKKENPVISGSFMDWQNPYEVAEKFNTYHDNAPDGTINQAFTQSIHVSAATYSEAMVNAGGKVFLFQTDQQPSSHVSDMQYFIGMHREKFHTNDMDIMDTFYLDMILNFTTFGTPSPNWTPLNPSKMNYYALEVNARQGIMPRMKNGFHEEDVNFWYINMTAFDREVTRQKHRFNFTKNPMHPGPVILRDNKLSVDVSWWFYVLVFVVALIVFYLIYVVKVVLCRCRGPARKNGVDETAKLLD